MIENPDVSSPGLVARRLRRPLSGAAPPGARRNGDHVSQIARSRTFAARNLATFFSFPIPCVFITKGQEPGADLVELAAAAGVALIRSQLKTERVLHAASSRGSRRNSRRRRTCTARSPTCSASGCCSSGRAASASRSACSTSSSAAIGSSRTISSSRAGAARDVLIGRGHELQRHHMEIRGVGLVDIPSHLRRSRGAPAEAHRGRRAARGVESGRAGRPHGSRHRDDDDSRRRAARRSACRSIPGRTSRSSPKSSR